MDCSKRSAGAGAAAALPDETLVEILSRLPAKSICRFKSVPKAWRDLIADPHNRKKLSQAMEGLFYAYGYGSGVDCFSFIDTTARSVPLDIDPCFSFLTELPEIQNLSLLDSCNGLILFKHYRWPISKRLGYIVCNPTTRQWRAVPNRVHPPPPSTYAYLAFDPAASSHFHLLEFEEHQEGQEVFVSVHAYSSETGAWNRNQIDKHKEQGRLKGWHNHICPCFDLFCSAYVNGILHFIVCEWGQDRELIGAVDVQSKIGKLITGPDIASARNSSICYVGQSQGRLHCVIEEPLYLRGMSYKLSIWVLQDYETQKWELKDTLSSLGLFGEISDFEVVNIHQDRNLVFLVQNDKLQAYDMDSKEVSVVATFGELDCVQDFVRYVPYFSELPALTNKH